LAARHTDPITFDSLLREMADPAALSRFPDPEYRQLQASSYNRESKERNAPGWFADNDGMGFIRTEVIGGARRWVVMEHEGPGCITKMWTSFFYYDFNDRVGPRIQVVLDGAPEPVLDARFIELLTNNRWDESDGPAPPRTNALSVPEPLAQYTARAGDLYLPIPFAKSCKITLDKPPFYYLINYRAYAAGTRVETLRASQLEKIAVPVPTAAPPKTVTTMWQDFSIGGEREATMAISGRPSAIRRLSIQLDPADVARDPAVLRRLILQIRFDGERCLWCPVGDFFCAANALHEYSTWSRTSQRSGLLECNWHMPFFESAEIQLLNVGHETIHAALSIQYAPEDFDSRTMLFHASWRPDDILPGDRFADWNYIEIEGRGVYVGDALTIVNLTDGWWGEGDEKIYVDDRDRSRFPAHFGTGTEDYYGWAGGVNPKSSDTFSHPFLANVCVGSEGTDSTRGFNICTRARALDAIPFRESLVFDLEASPGVEQRKSTDRMGYSAVTFWYAFAGARSNRDADPAAARRPAMSYPSVKASAARR
jgi:hypothetical protein